MLVINKELPANNLQEFIAYAKANKGKLNFGSAGAGSATHLGCVLFNAVAGIEAAHVPYRGSGPAMNDVIDGQIQYLCDVVSTGKPQVDAGTVKAVAFMGKQRSPVLPDLPTADEQGLKGFEAYTWNAIFVAKGTPSEIVKALNAAALAAMNDPGREEAPGRPRRADRQRRSRHARVPGRVRQERDREMGRPHQGQRRAGGVG